MKKLKLRIKALDKISGNKTHVGRSALDVFMAGALFGLYSKKFILMKIQLNKLTVISKYTMTKFQDHYLLKIKNY
jgi:hypothetical protein